MPKINKIKPVVKKFNRLQNQLFAKRVVQFFTNEEDHQKNPTCKHFMKEGNIVLARFSDKSLSKRCSKMV
jgi:hypothetical protein